MMWQAEGARGASGACFPRAMPCNACARRCSIPSILPSAVSLYHRRVIACPLSSRRPLQEENLTEAVSNAHKVWAPPTVGSDLRAVLQDAAAASITRQVRGIGHWGEGQADRSRRVCRNWVLASLIKQEPSKPHHAFWLRRHPCMSAPALTSPRVASPHNAPACSLNTSRPTSGCWWRR